MLESFGDLNVDIKFPEVGNCFGLYGPDVLMKCAFEFGSGEFDEIYSNGAFAVVILKYLYVRCL